MKIPTAAQHHRTTTGNRANHVSDKYIKEIGGNSKLAGIGKQLSQTPGLNSSNINRQQTAYAVLMLANISTLTNTSSVPSISTDSKNNSIRIIKDDNVPILGNTINNSAHDSILVNALSKVTQNSKNDTTLPHHMAEHYVLNNHKKKPVKSKGHNYDDLITFPHQNSKDDTYEHSQQAKNNHKKKPVKSKGHNYDDLITFPHQNSKNDTYEHSQQAKNNTEMIHGKNSNSIIDDNRNNKNYLLHRFKLFMKKHQKFELLDDYDLASCFLAKKQLEYLKKNEILKIEESQKYPRLDNFSLKKVTVLINKNITSDITLKIYNLATEKENPEKFNDFIKQKGNKTDEIEFYETYHLYKKAILGYSAGMKKDSVMVLSHIRMVSDELYATDKSMTTRIEYLKIELYHLTKLLSKRIDIEFRPLFVTATLKNGFYYPPFEERSAAGILENVVYDIQDIPNIQLYNESFMALHTKQENHF